jgi:hypothetical protein
MSSPAEINALHNKAMDLAGRAFHADIHGDYPTAESLFKDAFDLERRAALLVVDQPNAEPTRSVLLRSAATLAVDCHEFREAERLIALALAGHPPSEVGEELRDLLETVYFSRHLSLRGLELDPGEFQVSLTGGAAIGFGLVESSQFLRRADLVEKLLVRTVERLHELPFRETGSPNREALDGFELFFSTPRAASFAFTVRLGRPVRQELMPGFIGPREVVEEFLICMEHFNADDVSALHLRIQSEPYFNNFTALTRKLAPDGRRVRAVGFTSKRGDEIKEVALSHPAASVWRGQVDEQRRVELIGMVRSADETSKRGEHPVFGIEDDNQKTHTVTVPPGILQDIVRPYWGERVKVVATRTRGSRLQLVDIEPYEQGQQSET